jgi:hypothetical protein
MPQTLRSKDGTVELSWAGTGAAAANDQVKDSRNGNALGAMLRIAASASGEGWFGGIRLESQSHWVSDLPGYEGSRKRNTKSMETRAKVKRTLAAANHNDARRPIMPKSYSARHPLPG